MELLDHIAAQKHWQIEYVPDTFQHCLEKLESGDIDLLITIAYSEERAKRYDFNQLNVVSNWGVLYTPDESRIASYFDLAGKRVAVMRGDTHHRAFRHMLGDFNIDADYLEFDNFQQIFEALERNAADAGVVSRFYALTAEHSYRVKATPIIFNPIEVRYATAKGSNPDLLEGIDDTLEKLKADPDSAYYKALEHWLGVVSGHGLPPWLRSLVIILGVVTVAFGGFIVLLRRQVRLRTRSLRSEIAARRRTQKELLLAEEQYRTLVEYANAIILHWNPQGTVTFLNDFGERLFGFARGELIGKNVVGTIVPEQDSSGRDLAEMIHAICNHPEDFVINENENITRDGRLVWISWRNRPVRNAAGELIGILSVGIDITEKKQAEKLRQEYDQIKDAFISTAAHELRTPLTSILGFAELLRTDQETPTLDTASRKEFLDIIRSKGERLDRIVDDLLDVSRINRGIPLPHDCRRDSLAEVARETVRQYQLLAPSHPLRIEQADSDPLESSLDRDRITQVFENLLGNAVKYSPPGSEIVVTLARQGDDVQACVSDRGIGMTREQVDVVFDNFFRVDTRNTAVSGLGLGLSISRQIVRAHGGDIRIDSTPGQGTRVCFTLPALAPS